MFACSRGYRGPPRHPDSESGPERLAGLEPRISASRAVSLPLGLETTNLVLVLTAPTSGAFQRGRVTPVGVTGIEPAVSPSRTERSTRLSYTPMITDNVLDETSPPTNRLSTRPKGNLPTKLRTEARGLVAGDVIPTAFGGGGSSRDRTEFSGFSDPRDHQTRSRP